MTQEEELIKYKHIKETLDLGLVIKTKHGFEIRMDQHEDGYKLYTLKWKEYNYNTKEVMSGGWRHYFPISSQSSDIIFIENELTDENMEFMINYEHEEKEIRDFVKLYHSQL